MATMIDHAFAQRFAAEWIAAWNAGDLERVFALYRDDFEMRSPLIAERGFAASGVLRGKGAIRPYWGGGIAKASPPLQFQLIHAYAGVGTVALHYRSVGRQYVIEVIELDDTGLGVRGCACHGAADTETRHE
jgi:ketosteroid isomerase-like protein